MHGRPEAVMGEDTGQTDRQTDVATFPIKFEFTIAGSSINCPFLVSFSLICFKQCVLLTVLRVLVVFVVVVVVVLPSFFFVGRAKRE